MTTSIRQPTLASNPSYADYTYFKRSFINYCIILKVKDDAKLPLLQNCLGRDGLDLFDGLPEPKTLYNEAIARLDDYFNASSSLLLKRKTFYSARQESNESVSAFAVRLRRLAKECNFSDSSFLLRDIFVMNVRNNTLGEKLLSEDAALLTFESAVQKAEAFERARSERTTIHPTTTLIASVNTSLPSRNNSTTIKPTLKNDSRLCYRCGSPNHLANNNYCPARKAICKSCNKVGHYAKFCCARPQKSITISTADIHNDNENAKSYSIFSLSTEQPKPTLLRQLMLNDTPVTCLIDTGAEINILPSHISIKGTVFPTKISVKAYGAHPLVCIGQIETNVCYNSIYVTDKFVVV